MLLEGSEFERSRGSGLSTFFVLSWDVPPYTHNP